MNPDVFITIAFCAYPVLPATAALVLVRDEFRPSTVAPAVRTRSSLPRRLVIAAEGPTSERDAPDPIKRSYWWQLVVVGGVTLAVGVGLAVLAVADGASTKDVSLAVGTGLLTAAIVTVAIGLIDRRREDAETMREEQQREWELTLTKRLIVAASSSLRGADLGAVTMVGQDLRGKDFMRANLRGADLRTADLSDAILADADLRSADLHGAWLSRADCRSAHLEGADLRFASARGTDFGGAYLDESTDFSGADLRSTGGWKSGGITKTSFHGAVFVNPDGNSRFDAQMKAVGAKFDDIEWPDGIDRPDGAIEDRDWLIATENDFVERQKLEEGS